MQIRQKYHSMFTKIIEAEAWEDTLCKPLSKKDKLHTVIARIAEGNEKSVYLHESVGFKHIGIMKEVGRKFGKRLDVHLMQLLYRS